MDDDALICPSCGQYTDEATDPDLAAQWTADYPTRDHACTALHKRMAEYTDPEKTPEPRALRFRVHRRDT